MNSRKILLAALKTLLIVVSLQALVVLISGGYMFSIGPFRISSHRPGTAILIQIVLAAIILVIRERRGHPGRSGPRMESPASPGKQIRFIWAAVIGIAALAVLAYHQVPSGFFLSDDFEYLRLFDQAKSLTSDILFGYLKGFGLIRPLSLLSLYGDFSIWHLNPWGYHVTSLILHIINAGLLLVVLLRLSGNRKLSLCGALLFSVHPLHPEAVTWISGRFDVLCGTFYLLAMVLFLASSEKSERFRPLYLMSLGSFLAALLSKEMAFSLPLILLLIELVFRIETPAKSLRERWKRHVPYWLLGLGYFGFRLVLFHGPGGYLSAQAHGILSSRTIWDIRDLLLRPFPPLFLPLNSTLYPNAGVLKTVLSIALVIAILWAPFRKRVDSSLLLFGFCVIPLAVLPAFRIFFVSSTLEGARLLYLPSIGTCIMIAAFFKGLGERRAGKGIWVFLPVVLFFVLLLKNNTAWKSASEISQRITHQAVTVLNDVKAGEKVFVRGLPDNFHGAYVFRNGFPAAVSLFGTSSYPQLIDMKNNPSEDLARNPGSWVLEWTGERFLLQRNSPLDPLTEIKK